MNRLSDNFAFANKNVHAYAVSATVHWVPDTTNESSAVPL